MSENELEDLEEICRKIEALSEAEYEEFTRQVGQASIEEGLRRTLEEKNLSDAERQGILKLQAEINALGEPSDDAKKIALLAIPPGSRWPLQ